MAGDVVRMAATTAGWAGRGSVPTIARSAVCGVRSMSNTDMFSDRAVAVCLQQCAHTSMQRASRLCTTPRQARSHKRGQGRFGLTRLCQSISQCTQESMNRTLAPGSNRGKSRRDSVLGQGLQLRQQYRCIPCLDREQFMVSN